MASASKVGRNAPCTCGSGKKFKHCCATKVENPWGSRVLMAIVLALVAGGVVAGVTSFTSDGGSATPAAGQVWSPEHGHYH